MERPIKQLLTFHPLNARSINVRLQVVTGKMFFFSGLFFYRPACTILAEIRRNENDTLIKELVLHNVRCWCAAGSN